MPAGGRKGRPINPAEENLQEGEQTELASMKQAGAAHRREVRKAAAAENKGEGGKKRGIGMGRRGSASRGKGEKGDDNHSCHSDNDSDLQNTTDDVQ